MPDILIADKQRLWQGAVFGGIVSGIMSAKDETYGRTRFWEETAYVCDGLDGREGTVFFEGSWRSNRGWAVGLFFDPKSDLSPHNSRDYDLERLIARMPAPQSKVTEETVRSRMFDEIDGVAFPLVAAAFWNTEEDGLAASVSWEDVFRGGAELISKDFKGVNPETIAEWQADYEMPDSLMEFVVKLYHRRVINPKGAIELEEADMELLRDNTDDPTLGSCQQYLSMMEIYLPH